MIVYIEDNPGRSDSYQILAMCFPIAALDARSILKTSQKLVHHDILFKTGMSSLSNCTYFPHSLFWPFQ